jgi:hypothetical protein
MSSGQSTPLAMGKSRMGLDDSSSGAWREASSHSMRYATGSIQIWRERGGIERTVRFTFVVCNLEVVHSSGGWCLVTLRRLWRCPHVWGSLL